MEGKKKNFNLEGVVLRSSAFLSPIAPYHIGKGDGYHPQSLNHPEVISDAQSADDLDFLLLSLVRSSENLIRDVALSEFEDYFFHALFEKL